MRWLQNHCLLSFRTRGSFFSNETVPCGETIDGQLVTFDPSDDEDENADNGHDQNPSNLDATFLDWLNQKKKSFEGMPQADTLAFTQRGANLLLWRGLPMERNSTQSVDVTCP